MTLARSHGSRRLVARATLHKVQAGLVVSEVLSATK